MSAHIERHDPTSSLTPYVAWYWGGTFNALARETFSQRVIPHGYVDLIIHLSDHHCDLLGAGGWRQSPDYTLIGLYTQPYEVVFSRCVRTFGIRFKPEGIYSLFGVPAAEFHAGFEDITLVLGKEFRVFCDQIREATDTTARVSLTEQYLAQQAARRSRALPYLGQAAECIRQARGGLEVETVQAQLGISLRQLQRQFKAKVGVSPKHYLRMARINEVQRLLEAGHCLNLTQIAYQAGYTDQAHFIRDFKAMTGETPSVFVRNRDEFLIHASLVEA